MYGFRSQIQGNIKMDFLIKHNISIKFSKHYDSTSVYSLKVSQNKTQLNSVKCFKPKREKNRNFV